MGFADGHVDVLVAHTLQYGLLGGGFVEPGEGHIFFGQARERGAHLGRISLGLGRHRHAIQRAGILGRRQRQRMAFITQGVARAGIAQLGHRENVSGVYGLHRHLFFAADDG